MASPIYARTVARLLERHLEKCPESSIHWVAVASEVGWGEASIEWPELDYFGFHIRHGHNEGMQVDVTAEVREGNAVTHKAVLTCKFLCGYSRVYDEAKRVQEFIDALDRETLLKAQY